jgi:flagellar motor switch protein FliM
MSSSEFLTQDEVDALLTGVDGVDGAAAPAEPAEDVRPFDPVAQDPALRGRMTAIEVINERFRCLLRASLFNFMGRVPEVVARPVRAIKYSDFTAALLLPANLNVVRVKPLPGNALVVFEPALVYLVVDTLFGGDGRFQPRTTGRECTPTDHGIIQRMLGVIFSDYEKSWQSLYPLKFESVRSEWSLQLANVADPADMVITMTFTIESGSASGAFHICIPYTTLEPIRDLLHGNGERKEAPSPDEHWMRTLGKQVQATEVELVAELVKAPVTVAQVLSMAVGDILSVEIPETVQAEVDGVPIFNCRYGTLNGQYALRIASTITHDRDSAAGEHHAQ